MSKRPFFIVLLLVIAPLFVSVPDDTTNEEQIIVKHIAEDYLPKKYLEAVMSKKVASKVLPEKVTKLH